MFNVMLKMCHHSKFIKARTGYNLIATNKCDANASNKLTYNENTCDIKDCEKNYEKK